MNNESYAVAITKNEMDDNEVPVEMARITGTKLHQLNDHCLLDIFLHNSLTPTDLSTLAETCKRFKQMAHSIFPKKFEIRSTRRNGHIFESFSSYKRYNVTAEDCEKILKNFGSRLVKYKARDDAVLDLVAKYCDGVALEHLIIANRENVDKIAVKLKSIFERVQKLSIAEDTITNVKSAEIMRCDSLDDLTLQRLDCTILSNTFPNLRRFKALTKFPIIFPDLFAFLSRHRLNYLYLRHMYDWTGFVRRIDESCKELKELYINLERRGDTADFSKLKNLTKLEILEIDVNNKRCGGLISLLRELKSLKTLRLDGKKGRYFEQHNQIEFFGVLSQLPNFHELSLSKYRYQPDWSLLPKLKTLELLYPQIGFCDADLQNIIKQLPILKKLEFKSKSALSENCFLAIVKIVQGRTHMLTLMCGFDFDYSAIRDDNQMVKLMQRYRIK